MSIPLHLPPPREPVRLTSGRYEQVRWFPCPACGAAAGQTCDGSRIATFDGLHFARRAAAEGRAT